MRPRAGTVGLTIAAAAALGLAGCGGDGERPRAPASAAVELGLRAERAHWQPAAGRLVVDGVSPRMAVMAVAPRRRAATLPTSVLRTSWRRLFAASGGATNVMIAATIGGRRRLIPVRARLVDADRRSRRLVFALRPLGQDRLPARPAVLRRPALLVDPRVTRQTIALWRELVGHFADAKLEVPADPIHRNQDGTVVLFTPGKAYRGKDAEMYSGPDEKRAKDDWRRVQAETLAAAGAYESAADGLDRLTFTGRRYEGLAIFGGPERFAVLEFGDQDGGPEIVSSAIFGAGVDRLAFDGARIAGLNMRGTEVGRLLADRTLFKSVDMSGARIGGEMTSAVKGSVFDGVRAEQPARFESVRFDSTVFQASSLPAAELVSTVFLGCGFADVDLSGADITGPDPAEFGRGFEPTFGNSLFERVKFDGATLTNVSFRGADFSGGGVSFDGATLNNVDFTDVEGLQQVDWSKVRIAGPVFGLAAYARQLDLKDKSLLRGVTFDDVPAAYDKKEGFEIDPRNGLFIDPRSGARLRREMGEGLVPVDPDGQRLRNPKTGHALTWVAATGVYDHEALSKRFELDRHTGRLRGA